MPNDFQIGPMPVRVKAEGSRSNPYLALRCSSPRCSEVLCRVQFGAWRAAPGYTKTRAGVWVKSLRAASRLSHYQQDVNLDEGTELIEALHKKARAARGAASGQASELVELPALPPEMRFQRRDFEPVAQAEARRSAAAERFHAARHAREDDRGILLAAPDFPAIFECSQCDARSRITGREAQSGGDSRLRPVVK